MENHEKSGKSFQKSIKKLRDEHDKIWMDLPDNIRLACADVIFRAIDQNSREEGTFRELIYGRLGLDMDGAYKVLYCAGAFEVSQNYTIPPGLSKR